MLLGLFRADKGWLHHLFAVAGLSYSAARNEIRAHWGPRPQIPVSEELPFSEQTERILRHAIDEAGRFAEAYVSAGHMLLGVLREEGSFAAEMLRAHGMTIDTVRERLRTPPAVAESGPDVADLGIRSVTGDPFNAIVAVERIRWSAEELARSAAHVDETRGPIEEIHLHLDALKQRLA